MPPSATGAVRASATQEHDGFDHWLIAKSFSMLAPMCGIGIAVTATLLLVLGAARFASDGWGAHPQQDQLLLWRAVALTHFCVFTGFARQGRSHALRRFILISFFVLSTLLFVVYAVLSWMLHGDLSTYAIFLLTMVCVFAFPGWVRNALNLAATASLVAAIDTLDGSQRFFTSGVAVNLTALALVSILIDRFLMRLNRALYDEKCAVERERERADRVLYNALPSAIAEELKHHNLARAERHPRMTVMFADIVGFTAFAASHAPDTVVQLLSDVFSRFDGLVDRFGVEKIKTIGDAYMVVSKNDCAAVALLALEMQGTMREYAATHELALDLRCGIHTGPAVAGVIGLKRYLYDVWGDTVNTASRMESTGLTGRIQVSESVYNELRAAFLLEPRGEIEVRGKGSMRTWFLGATLDPLPDAVTPSSVTISAGGS